jgi:ubiquinone/menaquinone biosynthesis C-methylase UbiE
MVFDTLHWIDPISRGELQPIITARTPAGVPQTGVLRAGNRGYPIVDCVARLTPESAFKYRAWLQPFNLEPPVGGDLQSQDSVESFGFQWNWCAEMRSDEDLRWRIADRFQINADNFAGKTVLDAGAGAGDQSRWLIDHGASVVSVDLSSAIDVVASKLRMNPHWFGVQGDITNLPFRSDQFDIVYSEGVIQHTRDSQQAISELCRVLAKGGLVLAAHYIDRSHTLFHRMRGRYIEQLRKILSSQPRYRLLLITGNLAALGYLPILGKFLRLSNTCIHSLLQPDFKTTWVNTFDAYGNHMFQSVITQDEFEGYFHGVDRVMSAPGIVVARKKAAG